MTEHDMTNNTAPDKRRGGARIYIVLLLSLAVLLVAAVIWQAGKVSDHENTIERLKNNHRESRAALTNQLSLIRETLDTYADKIESIHQTNVKISSIIDRAGESETLRDEVMDDLEDIEAQFERDREDIRELRQQLEQRDGKIESLDRIVSSLSTEIERQRGRIENLKSIIEAKNEIIRQKDRAIVQTRHSLDTARAELNFAVSELDRMHDRLDEMEHTAYVLKGSRDMLIENAIIEESGFFRKKRRLSPYFDDDSFQPVDTRSTDTFAINAGRDDVELIPPRPEGSYTLSEMDADGIETELLILDKERFWQRKYLVILTDS